MVTPNPVRQNLANWILAALGLLAATMAVFDYFTPSIHIRSITVLFVVAITYVGGLWLGIASAITLTILFSLIETVAASQPIGALDAVSVAVNLLVNVVAACLVQLVRNKTAESSRAKVALQAELARTKEREISQRELAEIEARYRAIGESIPFGIWNTDAEGKLIYISDSFLSLIGMTLEQVKQDGWLERVPRADAERFLKAWNERGKSKVWEGEYRIRGVDGKMYTILSRGAPITDERGGTVAWAGLSLDITSRKRNEDRLRFLAEISRILSLSLDPEKTLERIAQLIVPKLADWVSVDVVGDDGKLRRLAVLHANPEMTPVLHELREYPVNYEAPRGAPNVVKTGNPELFEDIPDAFIVQATQNERHAELLRQLGMKSAIVLPLIGRYKTLGALTMVAAESGYRYTQDDVAFGELIARRAALAYENALLYAREQKVADSFQRASLPSTLPALPGIELNATYVPGAAESEIGGDWYDAFVLPDGRLALSVGDVAGKGLRAAVLVGMIRQTLRAAVFSGASPGEVLSLANDLMCHQRTDMVTACFGVLDPTTLSFVYANAGHPPALLAGRKRPIESLTAEGVPLALYPGRRYGEASTLLTDGDLLVMYTDGLIENGRDIIQGERTVAAAVTAEASGTAGDPAQSLLGRVIRDSPQDDIAILTVRIAAAKLVRLDISVPAIPANAARLRQAIRRLAKSAGINDDRTSALVSASGEAISNVIEHAYSARPGLIHLRGKLENDLILIEIGDDGHWRAPRAEGRGRGLKLMRSLTDFTDVKKSDAGTTVRLGIAINGVMR